MAHTGSNWGMGRLPQLGAPPRGVRRDRIAASNHFAKGKAQNRVPAAMGPNPQMFGAMADYAKGGQKPDVALPVAAPSFAAKPAPSGLQVTWFGHSTMLIDLDGVRILTDPVFCERASPFQWMGPARFHAPPAPLDALTGLDAVVISHDHYDHLDYESIVRLAKTHVRFFAPLGLGAHLEHWGVEPERITELEWWDEAQVGAVTLACTPSRHFSGRGTFNRDTTLWSSWAMVGPTHRAWFSGDTGPFDEATEIGEKYGPFDLTMVETGAWHPAWGEIHLGPDEAERMHRRVRGKVMMPVHWGTFSLAPHRWDQPVVRLQHVAREHGSELLVPVAGQTADPAAPFIAEFWRDRAATWAALGRSPTAS